MASSVVPLRLPAELTQVMKVVPVKKLGEDSGLVWTARVANRIHVGDVAGRLGKRNGGKQDWQFMFKGNNYLVSRAVWYLSTGEDPAEKLVDHIDKNPLNNNLSNLRLADVMLQNNNKSIRRNNKSGAQGVSRNTQINKWRADVRVKGKTMYLGSYTCLLEAAAAYNDAVQKHLPEYAADKMNDLASLKMHLYGLF